MAALHGVLLLAMTFSVTLTQRTSMRSCDCEYTVDGRCAYTLMLPLANQEAATPYCPSDSNNNNNNDVTANARLDDLTRSVQSLETNMTQVNEWTMQNAQLLASLQSRVMRIQERIGELNDSTDTGAAAAASDGGDVTSADTVDSLNQTLVALQSQIDRQTDRVNTLADTANNLASDVTLLRNDYSTLETNYATLTDNYQRVTTRYDALNSELDARTAELDALRASVDGYRATGALCRERGLLVDGGANQSISDADISASSSFDANHGSSKARINYTPGSGPGSWCPQEPNDEEEWIQFDLGMTRSIYGVVTKGRADYQQWVTSYKVQYSAGNATDFMPVTDVVGDEEIFTGNTNQNTARSNMFWQPITARYVRIVPLDSFAARNKCLRADVIGCLDD